MLGSDYLRFSLALEDCVLRLKRETSTFISIVRTYDSIRKTDFILPTHLACKIYIIKMADQCSSDLILNFVARSYGRTTVQWEGNRCPWLKQEKFTLRAFIIITGLTGRSISPSLFSTHWLRVGNIQSFHTHTPTYLKSHT